MNFLLDENFPKAAQEFLEKLLTQEHLFPLINKVLQLRDSTFRLRRSG